MRASEKSPRNMDRPLRAGGRIREKKLGERMVSQWPRESFVVCLFLLEGENTVMK